MPSDRSAHRATSIWMYAKALFKLLGHAMFFALFTGKKRWVEHQIAGSRRLRQLCKSAAPNQVLPQDHLDLNKPRAGWLGHSTCWVQWGGVAILADPIWSKRCSPLSFFGPSRLQPLPISLDNSPRPSLVLISHSHFDHLDLRTLRKLHKISPKTRFFAPTRLGEWLTLQGIPATSVEVGKTLRLQCGQVAVALTCTPAVHYSQRALWDRNSTMCSSWMVQIEYHHQRKTFFFAGDTAYDDKIFRQLGEQFDIDLSFLPIGAYEPRIWLRYAHVDPMESVLIHKQIRSKLSIAIHHSTFMLGDPLLEQPLEDLLTALEKSAVSPREFLALEVGQSVNW